MNKKVLLNCVGYSLSQCYDSGIEITKNIDDDNDHLDILKELAIEYENLEKELCKDNVDISDINWCISSYIIDKIKKATTLDDVYNTRSPY